MICVGLATGSASDFLRFLVDRNVLAKKDLTRSQRNKLITEKSIDNGEGVKQISRDSAARGKFRNTEHPDLIGALEQDSGRDKRNEIH